MEEESKKLLLPKDDKDAMGDADVVLHQKMNEDCDALCNNICARFQDFFRCLWRIVERLFCDILFVVLFRPVFRALYKFIKRIPDAVGGILNPLFLIADALACCDVNGGKGWPALSVVSRIGDGGMLFFGCSTKKKRQSGQSAAFFGIILAFYFCGQMIDIIEHIGTDVVVPRLFPFQSLSSDGRIRNMNSGFAFLLALACYWATTVGWLEGKMSVLKWIPEALEETEECIRIASLKRYRKNLEKSTAANAAGGAAGGAQFKESKLEFWSHYFELLLSLPASVLGIFWDTMHQATLIKAWCGNNSYMKRGRKRMYNCASYSACCCCCCEAVGVPSRADDPYSTILARKALEFNPVSIAANNYMRGKVDKRSYQDLELERLQVEQYLKDVANNSVSEPVIPSKGMQPPSIANWKIAATENQQVQQLWALHTCEGLPIARIATCYNHTLYAIRNDLTLPLMPTRDSVV